MTEQFLTLVVRNVLEQQTGLLKSFLKDHVTLKYRVIASGEKGNTLY